MPQGAVQLHPVDHERIMLSWGHKLGDQFT